MDVFDVSAESRIIQGKSGIRKLKREGFLPGILYSEGNSIPLAFKQDQIRPALDKAGEEAVINLSFEGKTLKTVIMEVQRNPVNQEILHVDLKPLGGYLH